MYHVLAGWLAGLKRQQIKISHKIDFREIKVAYFFLSRDRKIEKEVLILLTI